MMYSVDSKTFYFSQKELSFLINVVNQAILQKRLKRSNTLTKMGRILRIRFLDFNYKKLLSII